MFNLACLFQFSGKDTHVPSNIRKADNFTTSPAPIGLEPGTVPLSLSEKSYTVKHVQNLKQKIQTKDKEGATSIVRLRFS